MDKTRDRSASAKKAWERRRSPIKPGDKFHRLTLISFAGKGKQGHLLWNVRCDCGVEKVVAGCLMTAKKHGVKSCGCLRNEQVAERGRNLAHNLTGRRFGLLKVIRRDHSAVSRKPKWHCRCKCGKMKSIAAAHLKNGVQSCGCLLFRKGKDNPSWRGGRNRREGYIMLTIYDADGKKRIVSEHRHIMEKKLGRRLLRSERVHHKNGRRDDNRPTNLELWLHAHPSGQRVTDLVKFSLKILRMYARSKLKS